MFRVGEEVTKIEDLEDGQFYLHKDTVGTFEVDEMNYSSFDAIFHPKNRSESGLHYTVEETGIGESFTKALLLHRVVPDQLYKCPNCGSAAGSKEDESGPKCFSCGYGTEEGVQRDFN